MSACGYIGLDIGITGAVAFVAPGVLVHVEDLPTRANAGAGMVRNRLDGAALVARLRAVTGAHPARWVAVFEAVHTFPGRMNSPQSQGSLMHSLGVIECALDVAGLAVMAPLTAQAWKRFYGLGAEKEDSRHAARQLLPQVANLLARKRDHNRAEALLIAAYALRHA